MPTSHRPKSVNVVEGGGHGGIELLGGLFVLVIVGAAVYEVCVWIAANLVVILLTLGAVVGVPVAALAWWRIHVVPKHAARAAIRYRAMGAAVRAEAARPAVGAGKGRRAISAPYTVKSFGTGAADDAERARAELARLAGRQRAK